MGVPITVEDRLWGVMIVGSREAPLPPDTEGQLAAFTELVATAIANAEARVLPHQDRVVATQESAGLRDDSVEDLVRLCPRRDKHRHPPQRVLFLDPRAGQASGHPGIRS